MFSFALVRSLVTLFLSGYEHEGGERIQLSSASTRTNTRMLELNLAWGLPSDWEVPEKELAALSPEEVENVKRTLAWLRETD